MLPWGGVGQTGRELGVLLRGRLRPGWLDCSAPGASCLPGLGGALCSVLPAVMDRDLS